MHIKIGKVKHCQVHAHAVEPLQSEVLDEVKRKRMPKPSNSVYECEELELQTSYLYFKIRRFGKNIPAKKCEAHEAHFKSKVQSSRKLDVSIERF